MVVQTGRPHSGPVHSLRARVAAASIAASLAGALVVVSPHAAGAAGALDPPYGSAGIATVPNPPNQGGLVMAGTVDPLGRTVLDMDVMGGHQLVRFTADGLLDDTFGTHGIAAEPAGFAAFPIRSSATEIALGGSYYDSASGLGGPAVLMLHADGTRDTRYGVNGLIVFPTTDNRPLVTSIPVRADGSLAFIASAPSEDGAGYAIYRYRPDGTADAGFGTAGVVHAPGRSGWDVYPMPLGIDANGQIIYVEFEQTAAATNGVYGISNRAMRLQTNGTVDPSFGHAGATTIPGGAVSLAINDQDGSIYLAGRADATNGGPATAWRLRPDGRFDAGFGTNGQATAAAPSQPSGVGVGIAVLPSGRIAVEGTGIAGTEVSVLRPDGTLETGFGDSGMVTSPDQFLFDGVGPGTNGRVLLAGRPTDTTNVAGTVRAWATNLPSLAPSIPSTPAHPNGLSVTWTPPAGTAGGPIRAYYVVAVTGTTLAGGQVVGADVRQASIAGLQNGTVYRVIVTPYTTSGPGVPSAPAQRAPGSAEAPIAPAGPVQALSAAVGRDFATVTWAPPADDGGAPISTYCVIALNHATGALAAWRNLPADVRSAAVPGLAAGTTYDLYVVAATAAGFGQLAPAVAATPATTGPVAQAPSIPWATATAVGSSAVVTWGPPTEQGQATTHVNVIAIQNGAMSAWQVTGPDQRQTTIPLASAGTAQIYVIAQSQTGYGPLGTPLSVTP